MKTDFAWYGTQTFFGTEIKDAAYIQHSLRYSGFYHPHVWRWHGAMGRHHRWSFSYAKRRRIYSSFSRPFRSVYSPHLLWRTFTFFSSGTEYLSLRLIISETDQRRQDLTLYTAHSRRSVCAGCAMQKNLALHHRCGIFYKATTLLFDLSDQRPVSKYPWSPSSLTYYA